MAVEVKQFRKLFYSWLSGLTALTDLVGTRIYYRWPARAPTYPMVTYAIRNRVSTVAQYGLQAWDGTVQVDLYSLDTDELDALENAILGQWASEFKSIASTLTDSNVITRLFLFEEVDDAPEGVIELDNNTLFVRTIVFKVGFGKSTSAW